MIQIIENGLNFELNKIDFTAKIISSPQTKGFISISRSVVYESQDYIIISINKDAFKNNKTVKSIEFTENSELLTICEGAFCDSSIERISMPSSLIDLKEGWCQNTPSLIDVSISPKNKHFKNIEGNMIVGKLNEKSDDFDVLVFANRNIEEVKIPKNIKHINSFSFSYCDRIRIIDLTENEEIESIGEYSFSCSSLEKIKFSSNIKKIGHNSFMWCKNLHSIEIPSESKLQSIEKETFDHSSIKSIFIPKNLTQLKEGWCSGASRLNDVFISQDNKNFIYYEKKLLIGKSNPNNDFFDVLLFAQRDIEKVTIPSFIKCISSFAFSYCSNLESIEFLEDSKLNSIGEGAFSYSPLTKISIPSNVVELKEGWCQWTSELTSVSISPKNKHFKNIEGNMIVGKLNEKSDDFDVLVFANRNIEEVKIPKNIKHINSFSFSYCDRIRIIDLTENEEIESIGEYSFSCSSLEKIKFSSNIKKIGHNSFMWCKNLHSIEIPSESKLQSIEKETFAFTSLVSVKIPPQIKKICDDPFLSCNDLYDIEFLGDRLMIDKFSCKNLIIASFPNARYVSFSKNTLYLINPCCSFFFPVEVELIQ